MAGSLSRNRLKWLSNTGLLRSVRGPGLAAVPLLSIENSTRFSASLSATCPGYAPKANGTANILTSLGAAMRAIVALLPRTLNYPKTGLLSPVPRSWLDTLGRVPPLAARNKYYNFRDEAADTGDQRNLPIDLARKIGFHECKSTFVSEPITGLFQPFPPLR